MLITERRFRAENAASRENNAFGSGGADGSCTSGAGSCVTVMGALLLEVEAVE